MNSCEVILRIVAINELPVADAVIPITLFRSQGAELIENDGALPQLELEIVRLDKKIN